MAEPVFQIPNESNWTPLRLDEICSLVSRGRAPTYVTQSDVLAIGQRCVAEAGFDPSPARPHSATAMNGALEPMVGDVLLNSTGTGTIGRSCVFHGQGRFVVDGHITVLRTESGVADGRWLNAVLRTPWGQGHLETQCYSGSTNQVELSRSRLAASRLPVPPLPEQTKIAEILDTVDDAIRKTEQIIAKLEQVKQGLLHDLLTRGIDENGELRDPERHPEQFKDSELGQIPREWTWPDSDGLKRLGEVEKLGQLTLGRGVVISRHDLEASPGNNPVYSSSAVGRGEFGRYGRFMFDEELITWSVDGGGRLFYRPKHRFSVTNVCGYLRLNELDRWNYRFLHSVLEAQHASITFDYQMKAHPSVIRDLYWLPSPPLEEQVEIGRRRSALEDLQETEHAGLDKLRLLKKGLMEDLLTGKVRVTPLLAEPPA